MTIVQYECSFLIPTAASNQESLLVLKDVKVANVIGYSIRYLKVCFSGRDYFTPGIFHP